MVAPFIFRKMRKFNPILFVLFIILISSCRKDDVTSPEITLIGNASDTISLNTDYVDPGVSATDDRDGDLTAKVNVDATALNKDFTGTYTITYTVSDEAGNTFTATRKVIVKNDADKLWSGSYDANETDQVGPYTYVLPCEVTASKTVNNRIIMTRLGDYLNNTVYMNITGTAIDLPSQTVSNVGYGVAQCEVHNRMSNGTGVRTASGFTLNYSDSKVAPCSGSRTNVAATFIKIN